MNTRFTLVWYWGIPNAKTGSVYQRLGVELTDKQENIPKKITFLLFKYRLIKEFNNIHFIIWYIQVPIYNYQNDFVFGDEPIRKIRLLNELI